VYIFRLGDFHKIGWTAGLKKRLRAYKTLPYDSVLVHHFPSENPYVVEKSLHRRFRPKRVKGEWFRLGEGDIAKLLAVVRADSVDDLPDDLRGQEEAPAKGGSDGLRARGLKGVLVAVSHEEHDMIRKSAAEAGVPMNQFMRDASVDRARKVRARMAATFAKAEKAKGGEP